MKKLLVLLATVLACTGLAAQGNLEEDLDARYAQDLLKALHGAVTPGEVAFVSVSFDRTFEALEKYATENELPGVQLFDPSGKKDSKVADEYGVKWIPSLYLIDKKGKVELGTVVLDKIAGALTGPENNRRP